MADTSMRAAKHVVRGGIPSKIDVDVSDLAHGQAAACLKREEKLLAYEGVRSHNKPIPVIRVDNNALHTSRLWERRTIGNIVHHRGF